MSTKKQAKAGFRVGRIPFDTTIYGRNFGPTMELDGVGGGGGGTPPAGDPPAFDAAAFQTSMQEFVVKAVNGAVSTHLTRALDTRFEQNNEALVKQIQGLIPAPQTAPDPSTGNTDLDAQIKNATAPLMKQLEEQRALNERNAAAATASEAKRKTTEEHAALTAALTAGGVAGPLAQAAVSVLHGSLERDTSGNIVYVSKETGPTGPYDERVTVAEGVSRYLATDDGKHFLPARQVGGSGNKGGNAPQMNPGQQSDGEFVGAMLDGLMG